MSKIKFMNVKQVREMISAEEAEIDMAFATVVEGVMPKGWNVLDKNNEFIKDFVLPAEMVTFNTK